MLGSRTTGVVMFFFFQAEDGIRDLTVTGVQTCALPISHRRRNTPGVRAAREHYVFLLPEDPRQPRPPDRWGSVFSARFWKTSRPSRSPEGRDVFRSEEHTSELQSQSNLVCRLLLEKNTN